MGIQRELWQGTGRLSNSTLATLRPFYNLALALERMGDRTGAIVALEQAIVLDPGFAAARNQLGLIYLAGGKPRDAERQFEAALKNDPQCAECQSNLGVLYGQAGDLKRAEGLLRQAIENNPGYLEARVNLALILAGRGAFSEARQELAPALQSDPNHIKALTALGMVQGRSGDAAAVETLRRVVTLDPASAEARLNLGIALADRDNPKTRLQSSPKPCGLRPAKPRRTITKGGCCGTSGATRRPCRRLERACQLDPGVADAWRTLGIARRELQLYADAVKALQELPVSRLGTQSLDYLLGQSLQSLERNEEAVVAWKAALQIDRNHMQTLYSLFRATLKTDSEQARRYQARFEALQHESFTTERSRTLSNFAITSAKAGKWDEAVGQAKEALEVCGKCSSAAALRKNLGLIECQAGRFEEGERDLQVGAGGNAGRPGDPESAPDARGQAGQGCAVTRESGFKALAL